MIDYPHQWTDREKVQLARTLFYIYENNDYNFVEFIRSELLRLDRINRDEGDIDQMRVRQGACQTLEKLINMLKTADDMYNQLKSQHPVS